MPGKNKFVLVIDDEHMVHAIVEAQLARAGYDELSLDDPQEGLSYFKKHYQNVDAVIIDLTFRDMNGIELAEKLWEIKPGIPLVLLTGASPEAMPAGKERLFHAVIYKPFSKEEVIEAMGTAIGKAA